MMKRPPKWRWGTPDPEQPKLQPLLDALKRLRDGGLTAAGVIAAFESPSLVLAINDTKLLMPCVKCFELGISNTCDEGVMWQGVVATRSQRDDAWT
jgi:hypothetical protein